jgi:predicted alpha/beta hydrolase family esterase
MAFKGHPVRVLVVPGLHGSGPAHWQTWLQAHFKHAVRVEQDDWARADLARWSDRIGDTLARHPGSRWVAVAHSFGCLALAHHLATHGTASGVEAAVLVAPADPEKLAALPWLAPLPLPVPSVLLGSENDPWMALDQARSWARAWRARFINLGEVGHINAESGFGPLPQAKMLVELMIHRAERRRRLERAHPLELKFSV